MSSLEESLGPCSIVTDNCVDHLDFLTVSSFHLLNLGRNDFDVDIVAGSLLFKISDLDEDWLS
jgi:hypothetical protein